MKNSRSETITSLKSSNPKGKLDVSNIKSTDINILLNKVKLDQKYNFRKKIIYLALIVSAFLITGLITLI